MKHYLFLGLLSLASILGTIPVQASILQENDWGVAEEEFTYSNYGYINLTRGVSQHDITHFEKRLEGEVIHLSWVENNYHEPGKVWYLRSNDLGETWENPVLVGVMGAEYATSSTYLYLQHAQLMNVDHGQIYFMIPEDCPTGKLDSWDNEIMDKKLFLYRSTDQGKSFTKKEIVKVSELNYGRIHCANMKVVDGKIALVYYFYDHYKDVSKHQHRLFFAFSEDQGETFQTQRVIFRLEDGDIKENNLDLKDFYFDGSRLVTLHNFNGRVWMAMSEDGGPVQTQSISPSYENAEGKILYNAEVSNVHHNHQTEHALAMEGDRIYVVMLAQLQDEADQELVLVRSDNGGKNWKEPVRVAQNVDPENPTNTDRPIIAAKGDLVYVIGYYGDRYGNRRTTLYYSHDGGITFSYKKKELQDITNREYYKFYLDPNDPSGRTAYVLYNNFTWIKTTDGFNTICESFSDVTEHISGYHENIIPHLLIDKNQQRHWFILYYPYGVGGDYGTFKKLPLSVSYHQDGEPAPSSENCALLIGNTKSKKYWDRGMVTAIPNTSGLLCDSAATFEFWVKIDTLASYDLAGHSTNGYGMSTGESTAGWYFKFDSRGWIQACLRTDRDQVIKLETPGRDFKETVNNLKWHHLAMTFDGQQRLARFYMDGALMAEETVSGRLRLGPNPVFFGEDNAHPGRALIDNFRIWNRALTGDELRTNMYRENFEGEENLMVFLNFNQTLKDLSGKGNDARSLCGTYFVPTDVNFEDIRADFDFHQKADGEVVLHNRMNNATDALWDFGDGTKSTLMHPSHKYENPGEYRITLMATNALGTASASKDVVIKGLHSISPNKVGKGFVNNVTILGGGLTADSKLQLVMGDKVIVPDEQRLVSPGVLKAILPFEEAESGVYDVQVDGLTLPQAFTVEEMGDAEPWMSVDGYRQILINRWHTFGISYGNKGNMDAFNVPLYLFIKETPDMDVDFKDFEIAIPELDKDILGEAKAAEAKQVLKKLSDYVLVDGKDGEKWRAYCWLIPYIPANSHDAVHIRIKSSTDYEIQYWIDYPYGISMEKAEQRQALRDYNRRSEKPCPQTSNIFLHGSDEDWAMVKEDLGYSPAVSTVAKKRLDCLVEKSSDYIVGSVASLVPYGGCIYSMYSLNYAFYADIYNQDKEFFWNQFVNLVGGFINCGMDLATDWNPVTYALSAVIANSASSVITLADAARCVGGDPQTKKLQAVSSYDPNEMVGPSGYVDGDSTCWVTPAANMAYTIHFENKAEATAPAHTVLVSDTLDKKVYNLDDFTFTSVAWGDKVFNIKGNPKGEFTQDFDLRPEKPLIVRAFGHLDKEKGIVEWSLISLNPETMEEEENPLMGFLPPNKKDGEGQGFVSFIIGQQPDLKSGTKIANQATIIFDANAPILTNTYVNGIDNERPTSAAYLLMEQDDGILVKWNGSDASSGVAYYYLMMSKNDGPFEMVKDHIRSNEVLVKNTEDAKYSFYTIVTDNVGWTESKADICEVVTGIVGVEADSDAQLNVRASERRCELVMPHQVKGVQLHIFGTDGKVLQTEYLGDGNRFSFLLPGSGVQIVAVTADGNRYVWKVKAK